MKTGDYEWCVECDGEGKVGSFQCPVCDGRGYVESAQKLADIEAAKLLQKTIDKFSKRN